MTSPKKASNEASSGDIAKLFFDLFSKRVNDVEQNLKRVSGEAEALKGSMQRSQMSDLVLLERIQRSEGLLLESLSWIRRLAEALSVRAASGRREPADQLGPAGERMEGLRIAPIVSSGGASASLSAITTATEMQVLSLLAEKGPLGAPEIGRYVGRSREHTARLMKRLYQEGYVKRDQNRIPFRYTLMERVRLGFDEKKTVDEPKAPVSAKEAGSGVFQAEKEGFPLVKPPPA